MICFAEKQEARALAKIHKQEIETGFLSSLPISFLTKLYSAIIENDFCVVDKEGREIIGFIAGTKDIKKLYSHFLKRYFFYSCLVMLPKIFNIRKILEDIFYAQKKDEVRAELLTIAVKRDSQGRGIGKNMFDFFALEMKKRGIKSFKVLVGEELCPAISFYEGRGFKFLEQEQVHKGQKSRVYIYELE